MCPTGNHSQQRHKGFMPDEVFFKILEDIKGHDIALRFIRWGEPLHLNTNGSLLTEELARDLVGVPVDSVKFSFQGVDRESYKEMRNIDFFEGLIDKIALLGQARGDAELPFIQVSTTVTYEAAEEIAAFRKKFEIMGVADVINVGRTSFDWLDLKAVRLRPHEIAMLEKLIKAESLVKVHPECPEVFDKLSVNWDGRVTACCMDSEDLMVVGDVSKNTVAEIWRCDALNNYRDVLARMGHDELPLCKNCWDTHGLSVPGVQKV